mgnify:CR=1 FL=1
MAIEMFKRGSVEMLALLILNEDDAHGYRIVQEIKERWPSDHQGRLSLPNFV